MFNCPVCGYDRLSKPPSDYSICPSCGTEFGYSDAGPEPAWQIHQALRKNWIDRGAVWHSQQIAPPALWNPWLQLANAKLSTDIPWLSGLTFTAPIAYPAVVDFEQERGPKLAYA